MSIFERGVPGSRGVFLHRSPWHPSGGMTFPLADDEESRYDSFLSIVPPSTFPVSFSLSFYSLFRPFSIAFANQERS